MRALPVMLVVAALGIPLIPATSPAEDLSDLAAREKERRKGKDTPVYTDDDLKKKDDDGRRQDEPNGAKPEGGLTLTFNFPLDGDTVYGKVPLSASFTGATNVDAKFTVNGAALPRTTDIGSWINGAWDTAALPSGQYTIRLDAKDLKGQTGSAKITVTLSKTVNVDPVVASCKRSPAVPTSNIFGLNNAVGDDERSLAEMKDLGAKWVRKDFIWKQIELVQGTYDWNYADLVVVWAHDAGLQMLGVPNTYPAWVDKLDWPKRYIAFEALMKAMVERYKPGGTLSQKQGWKDGYGVSYWELWNEPNGPQLGWNWPPNPARYTLMLAHGTAGVRASDPNAFVLFGGLSNVGLSPQGFLEYTYVLGAKDCWDIFSHHPYGYLDRFGELSDRMRGLFTAYGDQSSKPIWYTEYGTISNKNRNDELNKVFAERSAAQGWFWASLRDSQDENWGVMTLDWGKKIPDYDTLKNLLSKQ